MLKDRILNSDMQKLIMTADEAAAYVKSDMLMGTSGFGTGYPKAIPIALSETRHATQLTLINGAARGLMHIAALTRSGIIKKVHGFQYSTSDVINSGNVLYNDVHLGQLAEKLRKGDFGNLDVAIIECVKINEDGSIVPTLSAGITETLCELADIILLEINEAVPLSIEGIHDFSAPEDKFIKSPSEHLGVPYIKFDTSKVKGIVMTNIPDRDLPFPAFDPIHVEMAHNLAKVFKAEIEKGNIAKDFTFQVGSGLVINLMIHCFFTEYKNDFQNLKMYTEVMGEPCINAIKTGLVTEVSSTSFDTTHVGFSELFADPDFFKKHITLRPLGKTNGAPNIMDQALVGINAAWEIDIYGNINSTHAMGVNMVNGIGGANDFCRNSKLSIFIAPSTAKGTSISRIVPMVPHVDNTEHDTDIILTEWGYADLRGLAPKERAIKIIDNCAHPDYRPQLRKYYDDALALCGPTHTPHDLSQCFNWYIRYYETGTMLEG